MKSFVFSLLLCLAAPIAASAQDTFSIVAIDPATGEFGSAGATCLAIEPLQSYISVVVPGHGAINAQGQVSPENKAHALSLMLAGYTPQQILDTLLLTDFNGVPQRRQYLLIDTEEGGRGVGFSGDSCLDFKGHIVGKTYVIAGNILLGRTVIENMENGFKSATGTLADHLMAALQGAKMVGADSRCAEFGTSSLSAFIRVARPGDPVDKPSLDLNVLVIDDPQPEPIDTLQHLYDAWKAHGGVATEVAASGITVRVTDHSVTRGTTISVNGSLLSDPLTLELYSVHGALVRTIEFPRERTSSECRLQLGAGIYFYRLLRAGMLVSNGKFIVD